MSQVAPAALPRVSAYLGISLDGCIAEADGGLGFLAPYQAAGTDYGYTDFMATVDAVVMGRATFDVLRTFDVPWPFGERPVVVLTHRVLPATPSVPATVSVQSGALKPLLHRLATAGVRHVYIDGGQVVRQALQEDVVDTLTLSVVPELLGQGRPLFGPEVPRSHWRLIGSEPWRSGLVQLRYERGEAPHAS